jgi:hypothetical protein
MINRGLSWLRVMILATIAAFSGVILSIGSYEMSGRDPLSTTVLLWVTACCLWLVVAALEKPRDRHSRFFDEISRWRREDAV